MSDLDPMGFPKDFKKLRALLELLTGKPITEPERFLTGVNQNHTGVDEMSLTAEYIDGTREHWSGNEFVFKRARDKVMASV